jgi:hypothetical protein
MRHNHSHLRSKLLRSHHYRWARILTALLILATTTANVGAVGFLHLCPVRGVAETDDCCCPEVEAIEEAPTHFAVSGCCPTLATPDRCACGKVLLVEDRSESVVRVSSDFDFTPDVLAVESAWIVSPQDLRLIPHQGHSPPRAYPRPAYLLFSSWTC